MELTQLIQFKTIADNGQISKAAEILYVSPPALSQSLKKLENELGCELFVREKKHLILNDIGREVLSDVNVLLGVVQSLKRELSEQTGKQRKITIASDLPGSLRYYVPMFTNDCSGMQLDALILKEDELIQAFIKKAVDIVILPYRFKHEGVLSLPFNEERITISVPSRSALARKSKLCVKDLDGQTFLRLDDSYFLRKLDKLCEANSVELKMVYQKDYSIYRQMSIKSDYIYFSSNMASAFAGIYQTRKYIPLEEAGMRETFYFTYFKSNIKTVAPFMEWLKKNYSTIMA